MKEVPSYPGYFADEDGNIWSNRQNKMKKLKPRINRSTGYYYILVSADDGKTFNRSVHSLVAEAFYGNRPDNFVVCHYPLADKSCNRPSNLLYASRLDNASHNIEQNIGRPNRNKQNIGADDAAIIKTMIDRGYNHRKIAEFFDLSRSAISAIKHGRVWKDIEPLQDR